jgi:hypothetical protein
MEKLAIDGGTPVRTKDPIVETDVFEEEERQALIEVAKSKKLRRAEAALEYGRSIAEFFGVKQGIAVSSGTTALHIASGTGAHVSSKWACFDTAELLEGIVIEARTRLEGAGGEGRWATEVTQVGGT